MGVKVKFQQLIAPEGFKFWLKNYIRCQRFELMFMYSTHMEQEFQTLTKETILPGLLFILNTFNEPQENILTGTYVII